MLNITTWRFSVLALPTFEFFKQPVQLGGRRLLSLTSCFKLRARGLTRPKISHLIGIKRRVEAGFKKREPSSRHTAAFDYGARTAAA